MNHELPSKFLWHKAGSESSLDITSTLNTKEAQRSNNPDGIILWGAGSTISTRRLQNFIGSTLNDPLVVISEIISNPRPQDITYINDERKTVRVWNSAISQLDGNAFQIPASAQVVSTSSNGAGGEANRPHHYALVCQSSTPLTAQSQDELLIGPSSVRIFDTKEAVRSSATLFPVEIGTPSNSPTSDKPHRILLTLKLVYPYIVKLSTPQILHQVAICERSGKYPV